jgi:hypothetical protein
MNVQRRSGKSPIMLGAPRLRPQIAVLSWRVGTAPLSVQPGVNQRDQDAIDSVLERLAQVLDSHQLPFVASDQRSGCAAAGLGSPSDPVLRAVLCALGMIEANMIRNGAWPLQLGIHYGPVCAGTERRPSYPFHLSGPAVATANAVRDIARPNTVTATLVAWSEISDALHGLHRGHIEAPDGSTVGIIECTGSANANTRGGI